MLFNSFEFLYLFLPVTWLGYYLLGSRNQSWAAAWVALASVFFYGYWSLSALPILLASIVFNYVMGLRLSQWAELQSAPSQARCGLLVFAVAANLVYLGFFKYTHFLLATVFHMWPNPGAESKWALDILLPIGISFFTFTQIAFLVDCKKGLVKEKNAIHYVLFVTFFPHLIAGPVLHHAQMMPQFANKQSYRLQRPMIAWGLVVFTVGLAKKLLIADPLSGYADALFNSVDQGLQPGLAAAWTGVLAYTFQIYFDFSGYSDMAIGLGLLFNIRLPVNFNHPYAARNIIDFWRRWHISLSTFLRDYLYIALGGNRHGTLRRYINLAITMLLGGLWHGANWTFVAWGAMHGLALVVNHGWRHLRGTTPNTSSVEKAFYWLLTFVFVCFTWVVFRADAMESAWVIYKGMLGLGGLDWNLQLPAWKREYNLYLSISLLLYLIAARHIKDWCFTYDRAAPSTQTIPFVLAAFTVLVFLISVEQIGQASAFLYFQF